MSSGQQNERTPIQKYLETASSEEQQEFAKTLLDAEARIREDGSVPPSIILASRIAVVVVVAAIVVMGGLGEENLRLLIGLVLLFAIVWFPNQFARATGSLGLGSMVRRPSHPGVLLVLGWLLLLVLALAAIFS